MHITAEMTDGVCRLRITGEATIYTVHELHRELFRALADCTQLEINLSEVSDMDTAGFTQLLLARRGRQYGSGKCCISCNTVL
jgi:anti-sigma B factor antagonist